MSDAKVLHFGGHQMHKGPSPMELNHFASPDGKDSYKFELPMHGHGQQFEHFMVTLPRERPRESEPVHARI